MNFQLKVLLLWLSGFGLGAFAVVADELQALQWFEYYNFPIIGQLPKYGGMGHLGAWDLTFVMMLSFVVLSMILSANIILAWEFLKK